MRSSTWPPAFFPKMPYSCCTDTTSTELTAAVRSQAPGEQVTLTVRRGGDERTVAVTLGSTS